MVPFLARAAHALYPRIGLPRQFSTALRRHRFRRLWVYRAARYQQSSDASMATQCCVLDPSGRWWQRLYRQQLAIHVRNPAEVVEARTSPFGLAHCVLESRGSVWIYALRCAGNGIQ